MARKRKRGREPGGGSLLAQNRQARRDYEIEETFEAGLVLTGTEVKSCREGRVQLKDAYAQVKNGEAWLVNCHVSPYEHAGPAANHEPERPRKLLLHRHQLKRLMGRVERAGFTLVPLRIFLKGSWIKVEIALARGRAKHEKRDQLKKKIQDREVEQALRRRR